MKQQMYGLAVAALLLIAAGTVETAPIIAGISISGMAAAVFAGKLWEVK